MAMERDSMSEYGNITEIIRRLRREYKGYPFLEPGNPFRVLVSTVLSQRTRDENTAKATNALFKKYKTPKEIANAEVADIESLINAAGFYKVKAKRIIEIAKVIQEQYNGQVPSNQTGILALQGVGRKTMNCVMVYGFGKNAIPVDTHVHRISNRLDLVETKTPAQTEQALMKVIPKKYWFDINRLFVLHGQTVCAPISPKCSHCVINALCPKLNIHTSR